MKKKKRSSGRLGPELGLPGRFFRGKGRRYLMVWWRGHSPRTILFEVWSDRWYEMAQWKGSLSPAIVKKRWQVLVKSGYRGKVTE